MRPELEEILRRRYPSLYDLSEGGADKDRSPLSPELGDGWFAILLALSDVMDRHATTVGLDHLRILKMAPMPRGGLDCHYYGQDHFIRGAVKAAYHMSLAVSSVSGQPGRLMVKDKECSFPLAPGEVDGHMPVHVRYLKPLRTPIGAGQSRALGALGRRWGHVVDHDISVPAGWADVADVVLTAFSLGNCRIDWIRSWDDGAVGQLTVGWEPGEARTSLAGAVAFATSMAALTDPVTGASGPVDDAGVPAWYRRIAGNHAMPPVPWGTRDADGRWISRDDIVCGPLPGHLSMGAMAKVVHGENGGMQLTLKPHLAQAMRQAAQASGDSCASFLTRMLGMLPDTADEPPAATEVGKVRRLNEVDGV